MKGAATMAWISLVAVAGFGLFNITFQAERLESELTTLNKDILKEQKAVHVLRAEWGFLNRPDRIEALVRRLLPNLGSADASRIGGWDMLDAPLTGAAAISVSQALRPAPDRGQP